MSRAYSDIAFTPRVRAVQSRRGSRSIYAPLDSTKDRRDALTAQEVAFIGARDGFYQATVSETGWPYVQYRGGPAGFLRVLDPKTVAYADFRGNVQYISVGNLLGNDRVSIMLMDYANQRRLKILGRVRLVDAHDDPALIAQLQMPGYSGPVERAVVIALEAFDWNCPKHITPRFTEAEIEQAVAPLHAEIAQLKKSQEHRTPFLDDGQAQGSGPLALRIVGVRQLTPRVRAFELRAPDGAALPLASAGSHLDVPVRLGNGVATTRRYSITSHPDHRDAYEIAVLLEESGRGGSAAVHADFRLGLTLHCSLPGNAFALHDDARPAVLIAGGIGITPMRAMAQKLKADGRPFSLHYAVRSRLEASYLSGLQQSFPAELVFYCGDESKRLDATRLIALAPADSVFYVCGPASLIDTVRSAAVAADIQGDRIRFERFLAAPAEGAGQPLIAVLARSGKRIVVAGDQSILEAVEAAGVPALSGCRSGSCGTCRVKVLAGEPEHRDVALSEVERASEALMCICVSRARTAEVTLDL